MVLSMFKLYYHSATAEQYDPGEVNMLYLRFRNAHDALRFSAFQKVPRNVRIAFRLLSRENLFSGPLPNLPRQDNLRVADALNQVY
jgi:hypothetical protein